MESYISRIDVKKSIMFTSLTKLKFKKDEISTLQQFGALSGYVIKNYTKTSYVRRNMGIDSPPTNFYNDSAPKETNVQMTNTVLLLPEYYSWIPVVKGGFEYNEIALKTSLNSKGIKGDNYFLTIKQENGVYIPTLEKIDNDNNISVYQKFKIRFFNENIIQIIWSNKNSQKKYEQEDYFLCNTQQRNDETVTLTKVHGNEWNCIHREPGPFGIGSAWTKDQKIEQVVGYPYQGGYRLQFITKQDDNSVSQWQFCQNNSGKIDPVLHEKFNKDFESINSIPKIVKQLVSSKKPINQILKSETIFKNPGLFLNSNIQKKDDFRKQFFETFKYEDLKKTLLSLDQKHGFRVDINEKAEEDILIKAACRGGRLDDMLRGMFLFPELNTYSYINIQNVLTDKLAPLGYDFWWKDNSYKATWPCVKLYMYHKTSRIHNTVAPVEIQILQNDTYITLKQTQSHQHKDYEEKRLQTSRDYVQKQNQDPQNEKVYQQIKSKCNEIYKDNKGRKNLRYYFDDQIFE